MAEREYQADRIRVRWDSSLCIHTARCINRAPTVFDPRRRPWVALAGADPDEVATAVSACPTGALGFERLGEDGSDERDEEAVVEVRPNGPYYVRGPFTVMNAEGEVVGRGPRLALCRCGNTENAPFCDNSHLRVGFRSPPSAPRDGPDAPDEVRRDG